MSVNSSTDSRAAFLPLREVLDAAERGGNYQAPDAPNYAEILRCTHCGLCLDQCPTYRVLGQEMDSPRGRIYQMRAVAEGRADVTERFNHHMNVCLACRACETACPAHVGFGQLVEAARWQGVATLPQSRRSRFLRWAIFRQIFPHPRRLRLLARGLRLYQRLGLQSLVRRSGLLRFMGYLGKIEALAPPVSPHSFEPPASTRIPAQGEKRATVAMISGCIMPLAYADTNRATVRVLAANGCEVIVPKGQICCGALNVHAGERPTAKEMARRNIAAFEAEAPDADAIIINAAGCGAALKEYGDLLAEDPDWAERAERFSRKVRDISEYLIEIGPRRPQRRLEMKVTYQDPCHLAHGQGVRGQPRTLLKMIPGLELIEMRDSDHCCGSAGIYNVVNYDLSMEVLTEKMANVRAASAQAIVSSNPGCILQLQHGCSKHNLSLEVYHIVDLLDRAYQTS